MFKSNTKSVQAKYQMSLGQTPIPNCPINVKLQNQKTIEEIIVTNKFLMGLYVKYKLSISIH